MQRIVASVRPNQRIGTKFGAVIGTSFALYSAYNMYRTEGQDKVRLAFANDTAAH